jgi:outer membrane immunogenic protein
MRKLLLSSVVLLIAPGIAAAADLPSRKDAPIYSPVPVYNWSGFYVGLNAGLGWSNSSTVYVTGPGVNTSLGTGSDSAGFTGGGQIGYNYQTGQWVFGVETDIQYADVGGKVSWGPYSWWGTGGRGSQWFGTLRARAGYAVDRTLFYVTGGLAYGGLNDSWYHGSTSNTGWTLGGGVEYAFTPNWTAKIEGLYINLENGNKSLTQAFAGNGVLAAGTYSATGKGGQGGGVVRVGVNYKF